MKVERLQPLASESSGNMYVFSSLRTYWLKNLPSDISISTTLPPKPIVFHGRDEFVSNAVRMLTAPSSARLAVLGPGGMGKTTIALAILYDTQIVEHLRDQRFFLSCEALIDTNSVVIALAKLLGLSVSGDLLTAIVARLNDMPPALLVLDNLETVWLADGGPAAAVEELLGRLAQIPSLSIIITCRGIVLPQLVEWSNPDTAALEPFSPESALETFQDRAGFRLTGPDEDIAKELLAAVDHMPLAVTLLGQLARRGTPVSELLDRWNSEHSALLCTHNVGRINNADVSVKLSITMVSAADVSGESLHLLSVCCMLPDGLRPDVLKKMSAHFKQIYRARDTLAAYALVSLGTDRVLRTLSPVRHVVLENHPACPTHRKALHTIYFDIAHRLPVVVDKIFQELSTTVAPEMGNLSSLLLSMVSQPSQKIVDAVIRLTESASLYRPTVTVASALLPHLETHPKWKADCLRVIALGKSHICDYLSAIEAANTAIGLYLELGDRSLAAQCKTTIGNVYRLLGEYNHAERLLHEARGIHAELGDDSNEAMARYRLALIMLEEGNYADATEYLTAARLTFNSLGDTYYASICTCGLGFGNLYLGEVAAAIAELEAARSTFISLGYQAKVADATRYLGAAQHMQCNFQMAEQYLEEAQLIYRTVGDLLGLACCAEQFGHVRRRQEREQEALIQYKLASRIFEKLQMRTAVQQCQKWVKLLESTDSATI